MQKLIREEMNRRGFLGGLAALAGTMFGGEKLIGQAATGAKPAAHVAGLGASGNVYEELGVQTVINGQGTMTYLGGSIIRPEVEAVMKLASQHFVRIMDLEAAAGKRIAQLLGLPAGYTALVTSGAASAIQNGYSGILTGSNGKYIEQLPDLTGLKTEVLVQKAHRSGWEHQIRVTGLKMVEVETVEDVKRALSNRTAAMHFLNYGDPDGKIKRAEWLDLAHQAGVPAFLDAAADTPPQSNLSAYAKMGYDLISFSGGKAMRGPQCAGLLIGRENLVHSALLNMSPNEGTIGRATKVGKEEIVGMVKAVELFIAENQDEVSKVQWSKLNLVAGKLAKIPGITTTRDVPPIANNFPAIQFHLDTAKFNASAGQICNELAAGKPSIILSGGGNVIEMNAINLQAGEAEIVANALAKALKSHSV